MADLRKRFKFLGEMGAFYFLYVVGEEVPSYEDWCASRGREPMTARPQRRMTNPPAAPGPPAPAS